MSGSRRGVTSSAANSAPAPAAAAESDGERLVVTLTDGRVVQHPLPDWAIARPLEKRLRCVVQGFGTAIYFPDLDEEIGVNELFGVSEDVIYDLAGLERRPFPSSSPADST